MDDKSYGLLFCYDSPWTNPTETNCTDCFDLGGTNCTEDKLYGLYILGISGAYLGHILGITWAYLGHILDISWAYLGNILGISGIILAYLGYKYK